MPRRHLALATVIALAMALGGCTGSTEPVEDARDALGTIVAATVYPDASVDASATAELLDEAFARIAATEPVLDAHASEIWNEGRLSAGYDPEPALAAGSVLEFNTSPYFWRMLPLDVELIIDRIASLGVDEYFSPSLYEVTALYDFEGDGVVPDPDLLDYYLSAAQTFTSRAAVGGTEARFEVIDATPPANLPADSHYRAQRAGLDLGGAHKGYALDLAIRELTRNGEITAALITAGSTTVTTGTKPDDEPWRVGVEHPRSPDELVATIESPAAVTVSTSGDYQRFFERDGVRYHHILDPATGMPARGLQSLTVVGARTALDSDILSTALFVMGPSEATAYAEEHGLGLVLVDDEGRVQIVPGPEDRTWEITAAK